MPIKIYKPTTPGRRTKASVVSSKDITKKKPEKKLTAVKKRKAGRSHGKITVRHRGGGAKRKYRIIDFKMDRYDLPAKVLAIEYDPNRNARIALVEYSHLVTLERAERAIGSQVQREDSIASTKSSGLQNDKVRKKDLVYIIAPDNLKPGDTIMSSKQKIELNPGNRMPLEKIAIGTGIYNIELERSLGAKLARSAGALAVLQGVEGKYAQIKMPSGEIRLIKKDSMASIGQVSNSDYRLVRWGKAGRTRHKGKRPTVRGKAMNPADHRHGGGEGRHSIGLKRPVTAWGKPALGVKTRKKNKWSNKLIVKRRHK